MATYAYLPLTRHTPRSGRHRKATRGLHPPWRVKALGDNRRASKVVQNCGVEAVANDGGNTTVHFYYGNPSRNRQGAVPSNVVETRRPS